MPRRMRSQVLAARTGRKDHKATVGLDFFWAASAVSELYWYDVGEIAARVATLEKEVSDLRRELETATSAARLLAMTEPCVIASKTHMVVSSV